MTLLILGLAIFFAAHLAVAFKGPRAALTGALGEGGRKGAVALVSLLGFGLLVWGYRAAPELEPLYPPLETARSLAHGVMPLAFILLAGSQIPSNFRRYVRHPMSLAVLAWAIVHLSANGDPASVLLFGGFALYALLDIFVTGRSGAAPPLRPRLNDLIAVVVGILAYGGALLAHGRVFGVYVTG